MIGKGHSISSTKASIAYGWNQEKDAEVVLKEYLAEIIHRKLLKNSRSFSLKIKDASITL